jgi:hypothetical protein
MAEIKLESIIFLSLIQLRKFEIVVGVCQAVLGLQWY